MGGGVDGGGKKIKKKECGGEGKREKRSRRRKEMDSEGKRGGGGFMRKRYTDRVVDRQTGRQMKTNKHGDSTNITNHTEKQAVSSNNNYINTPTACLSAWRYSPHRGTTQQQKQCEILVTLSAFPVEGHETNTLQCCVYLFSSMDALL